MIAVLKRALYYALLLPALNPCVLLSFLPVIAAVPVIVVSSAFYIVYNIMPYRSPDEEIRARRLRGGFELALAAIVCLTAEVLLYVALILMKAGLSWLELLINGIVFVALFSIMLTGGIIRIFISSSHVGVVPRILLLLLWWVPGVNVILLRHFLLASRSEYRFLVTRRKLDEDRLHEEVCKTKYPLLMVHGIFFRDWKHFNYWGRIPDELIKNGAAIYYGGQQSSASVSLCAEELKKGILAAIQESGAEKVNIIAHSKGGLDSRYAISMLGMGKYVASLTTVNTPHHGCSYVRKLMDILPERAVATLGDTYELAFSKLGDVNPDFMGGLRDLTDEECARLNEMMKDDPGVLYQSTGSKLHSRFSSHFPFNLGYTIIKASKGGDNDGLVSTESMKWGDFLGIVSPRGKEGISHSDMVDLIRRDIGDFDVCEFYVDLVQKLKLRGL